MIRHELHRAGTKSTKRNHLSLLAAIAGAVLIAGVAQAHTFGPAPDLGELIVGSDQIVRGKITDGSRTQSGARWATIRVDRVLRGTVPGAEVVFASDPNHGVTYARGERVVVFLSGRAPDCRSKCPPYSPQLFANKFRITAFDPTGFDSLVTGYAAAAEISEPSLRDRELRRTLDAARNSPEKAVRDFAVRRLSGRPAQP